MKHFKYTIILSVIFLTINCTKPYSFDLRDIEKRIVLNSLFGTDNVFRIKLTEEASLSEDIKGDTAYATFRSLSESVIGVGFKSIDNAQIIIYRDNAIVDTAYFTKDGNYYSDIKPDLNSKYNILIEADGFNQVEAESTIPTPVNIDSIGKMKTSDEYYNYQIKYIFNDPADEQNYYLVDVLGWYGADFKSDDPAIGEWHSHMQQIPIFNDELFDGQKYEFTIDLAVDIKDWVEPERKFYYLYLYSISKDLYLNIKSYNKQKPKFGDDLLELFQTGLIEPIPIYTNVEGGLGIFAGYAVSQDSLYFE